MRVYRPARIKRIHKGDAWYCKRDQVEGLVGKVYQEKSNIPLIDRVAFFRRGESLLDEFVFLNAEFEYLDQEDSDG